MAVTTMSDEYVTTNHEFTVHVHRDQPGHMWAEVEELPGCFASGRTLDQLWEALAEAVSLYLAETIQATRVVMNSVREVPVEPQDSEARDFRIAVTV